MAGFTAQRCVLSAHRPLVWIEMFPSFAGVSGPFFLLSANPFPADHSSDEM
jgi:hypothetical protein